MSDLRNQFIVWNMTGAQTDKSRVAYKQHPGLHCAALAQLESAAEIHLQNLVGNFHPTVMAVLDALQILRANSRIKGPYQAN